MSEPQRFRHPCTGRVQHQGFGAFLERELGEPRRNLRAFAAELGSVFGPSRITLVGSGSSANLAAATALAERAGEAPHAVACGFTFPTTLSALLTAGFSVTLADTEPDGFSLSPEALEAALRPSTKVVCVTHFLGFPADLPAIARIAERRGLMVLQDCCETMDLRVAGRRAFEWGTLATWSFYHPHHLSAFGGGAVLSPDAGWQRAVESIAHWGRACSCQVPGLPCEAPEGADHNFWYVRRGFNLELSELNACFGRFQLASWPEQERARRRNYALLYEALADHPALKVWPVPADSGSPFVFPISVRSGDAGPLTRRLAARGVEARNLMGGAMSGQPAFADLPHDGLARCRQLSRSSCFVGIHQTLSEEDVREVARIVAEEAAR
jgi:CDP-6-deoxy-D-xylo-4-hexulose-3-dehydrase